MLPSQEDEVLAYIHYWTYWDNTISIMLQRWHLRVEQSDQHELYWHPSELRNNAGLAAPRREHLLNLAESPQKRIVPFWSTLSMVWCILRLAFGRAPGICEQSKATGVKCVVYYLLQELCYPPLPTRKLAGTSPLLFFWYSQPQPPPPPVNSRSGCHRHQSCHQNIFIAAFC